MTAEEIVRFRPPDRRADLERAAKAGNMSIGAAMAFSVAGQEIKRLCPPEEWTKVAGLLAVTFARRDEP